MLAGQGRRKEEARQVKARLHLTHRSRGGDNVGHGFGRG